MSRHSLVGLVCILLCWCTFVQGSNSEIQVRAPWPDTSPALELFEALLDLPTNAFWRIIPEYQASEHDAAWLLEKAVEYTDSTQLEVVRLALATRYYHPVVASYRDLVEQELQTQTVPASCSSTDSFAIIDWIGSQKSEDALDPSYVEEEQIWDFDAIPPPVVTEWRSMVLCDGSRVQDVLERLSVHAEVHADPERFASLPQEHRRGGSVGKVHVMFYANPLSPRFHEDWSWLWDHVNVPENQVTLSLRWNVPASSQDTTTLSGFGVEWSWPEAEVQSTLSSSQLAARIATLVAEDSETRWSKLARVNNDLAGELKSIEALSATTVGESVKENWGSVNGRVIDPDQMDVYRLYEIIRDEVILSNILEHIDVPPPLVYQIMRTKRDSDEAVLSRKYLTEEEYSILSEKSSYVPLVGVTRPTSIERTSYRFATTETLGLGSFIDAQLDVISSKLSDENSFHDITHYLLLDLSTQQGLRTLLELANRFDHQDQVQEDVEGVRFALLHNCGCAYPPYGTRQNFEDSRCSPLMTDLFNIAGRVLTRRQYLKFIHLVTPEFIKTGKQKPTVDIMQILTEQISPSTIRQEQYYKLWFNNEWKQQIVQLHNRLIQQVFPGRFQPGTNYIVTNGRVIELPHSLPYFSADAFRALEKQERARHASLLELTTSMDFSHVTNVETEEEFLEEMPRFRSEFFMRLSSILSHREEVMNRYPTASSPSVGPSGVTAPVRFAWELPSVSPVTRRIANMMASLDEFMSESVHSELTLSPSTEEQVNAALRSSYQFILPSLQSNSLTAASTPVTWSGAVDQTVQVRLETPAEWETSPSEATWKNENLSFEVSHVRDVDEVEAEPQPEPVEDEIVAIEDLDSFAGDHHAPVDTHSQ